MENTPNIETERLLLRRFTKEDVSALFLLLSDRVVNTYLPMFALKSEKEAEEYLNQYYEVRYKGSVTVGLSGEAVFYVCDLAAAGREI